MKNIVKLLTAMAVAVFFLAGHAQDEFEIRDIQIDGLQKISPGTVFNYLPIKVGDVIDEQAVRDAIRELFMTGFFQDVQLEQEGNTLIVVVQERPSITDIDFVGNEEIKDEDLTAALDQLGMSKGRIFQQSVLDQVVEDLKSQYFSQGRYSASVEAVITPRPQNGVAITLQIDEGEVTKIKEIKISGNDAFSTRKLLKQFKQKEKRSWRFFSKSDRYSKQQFSADLENLRSYYQDRGYLDFEIVSTDVSITPDKDEIFITVSLDEGDLYTISNFDIQGDLVVPEEELVELVNLEDGQVFSRKDVNNARSSIADRLADEGFAFATVNAVPNVDQENKSVEFTFVVDRGGRVYVRQININGNQTTQDDVIRRELRQYEGSWYSSEKIKRSRVRLERLGYFQTIDIETKPVPGVPDQVDLEVNLEEKSTGNFLLGVGYSSSDGILLRGSVSQRNLFGTGRELSFSANTSDSVTRYDLSFRNPYYTTSGVSRGFRLSKREVDSTEADTAEYILDSLGGGVFYGFPLSEFITLNAGLDYERIDLEETSETPPEFSSFINEFPQSDLYKLTSSISHDTRDSLTWPTEGGVVSFSLEAALPGSDLEYYKSNLRTAYYQRLLSDNFVVKLGGSLGYGDGFGDTPELPFFENFFAGGPTTVRGYDSRSLGPKDSGDTPETIGGAKRILASAELLFPFPGAAETRDKRLGLFVDAGQVYSQDNSFDTGELRYSAGLSFRWISPVGPIVMSYGVPLNEEDGDEEENFQLTLGVNLD